MPVILPQNDYAKWLGPEAQDTATLQELLVPFPAEKMKTYPVSTLVNKSQNNGPKMPRAICKSNALQPRRRSFLNKNRSVRVGFYYPR